MISKGEKTRKRTLLKSKKVYNKVRNNPSTLIYNK